MRGSNAMTTACQAQEDVSLLDGTRVPIRPIRPGDAAALQRFHDRLSDRSVYLRFMGVMPHLSDAMAEYFTRLDGAQRVALVALDPAHTEEIIAVVRFDREPGTNRAEYAAVVADRWQGRGLGLSLTRRLIVEARRRGVCTLYALVLPENLRMLNLLHDLGLPERARFEGGVERIDVDLSPDA
jgi:GNAT superfamily N-acetyltransferase